MLDIAEEIAKTQGTIVKHLKDREKVKSNEKVDEKKEKSKGQRAARMEVVTESIATDNAQKLEILKGLPVVNAQVS